MYHDVKINGFQVIEELLYEDKVNVETLNRQVVSASTKFKFLHKNLTLQFLKEHHIYGSSRLGLENKEKKVIFSSLPIKDPVKRTSPEVGL